MAVVELTLVPIGEGISLSKYIAGAEKVLQNSNLEHEITAMGTNIEGELDDIFKAIRAMQETVFENGAKRVYSVIKIDDRREGGHKMKDKAEAVKKQMERRDKSIKIKQIVINLMNLIEKENNLVYGENSEGISIIEVFSDIISNNEKLHEILNTKELDFSEEELDKFYKEKITENYKTYLEEKLLTKGSLDY